MTDPTPRFADLGTERAALTASQRTVLQYLQLEARRLRTTLTDLAKHATLSRDALDAGRSGTLSTHRLVQDAADAVDREARCSTYREAAGLLGIPEHLIDAASIPDADAPGATTAPTRG